MEEEREALLLPPLPRLPPVSLDFEDFLPFAWSFGEGDDGSFLRVAAET